MKINSDTITAAVSLASTLVSMLPVVDTAIKGVQAAIPDAPGETKLAVAQHAVKEGFSVLTGVTTGFESMWPAFSNMIATLVASYRALGLHGFQATPPATAAAPTTGAGVSG